MAYGNRQNRIQQPFLPSSTVVLPIPQNYSILRGKVIVTGTITIAGGTTNGTVQGEGGPINLIKRIRIIGNAAPGSSFPNGWLVDVSGRALLRYAQVSSRFGTFFGEQSGSVLGSGAAGTYNIYLAIPIYFADDTLRPDVSCALYAAPWAYQSLQAQILTGGSTDCFAGTDRVWTYNLQVQWDDDRIDVAPPQNCVALVQEDHVIPIGAANTRLFDPALPADGAFVRWHILAEQNQPAYALSDALLNRITLAGPTFFFDEFAQDIRQDMYDGEWINPSANAAGSYLIDFAEGVLQNSNPAAGIQSQISVNNPSGAFLDQLRLYTRRIFNVSWTPPS